MAKPNECHFKSRHTAEKENYLRNKPENVYPVTNAAKALLAIAPTLIRSIRNKRYKRNENKGTPNAANATTTPWAFSLFCR